MDVCLVALDGMSEEEAHRLEQMMSSLLYVLESDKILVPAIMIDVFNHFTATKITL